jgi:hypothetical protein
MKCGRGDCERRLSQAYSAPASRRVKTLQIDFQARDKRVAIEFVDPAGKHAQTLVSI